MKNLALLLVASFIGMSAFINTSSKQSGITGSIDPADGVRKVWAVSGTDSMSAIPVSGKFTIVVKPGNWNLYVEAISPYKNTSVEGLLVVEGNPTDAGVIKLTQ